MLARGGEPVAPLGDTPFAVTVSDLLDFARSPALHQAHHLEPRGATLSLLRAVAEPDDPASGEEQDDPHTARRLDRALLWDEEPRETGGVDRAALARALHRGGKARDRARSPFDVLPLTYDIHALRAWLEDVEPHGVDDRGLRVGEALRAVLARSASRWRARRTVYFLADSPCGDLATATRAVTVHFRADRTRTRFTYVVRTRGSIPREYAKPARQGGTGAPELIR